MRESRQVGVGRSNKVVAEGVCSEDTVENSVGVTVIIAENVGRAVGEGGVDKVGGVVEGAGKLARMAGRRGI